MFFRKKTNQTAPTSTATAPDRKIVAIVFSKDRPLQLDAVLRSFALHCSDAGRVRVKVLYAASTPRYEASYRQVACEHPSVELVREQVFRSDLARMTSGVDYVLLLVDDNIFVRSFSLSETAASLDQISDALGFSLRLARNTTYCYPLSATQRLPDFTVVAGNILSFQWTTAQHDFGFPLEVSSSVYRVPQFLAEVLANDKVTNPNLLESKMHDLRERFSKTHPRLLCFEQSVTFCNPVNVVQTVSANRHSAKLDFCAIRLAERFELGYRIDVAALEGFVPKGCHHEVEFQFLPPKLDLEPIQTGVYFSDQGKERELQCVVDPRQLNEQQLLPVLRLLSALKETAAESDKEWFVKLSQMIEDDQRELALEFVKTLPRLYSRLGELEEAVAWFKEQSNRWEATAMQFKQDAEHWRAEAEKQKDQKKGPA